MMTTRKKLVFLMFIFTVAAAVPKPEEVEKKERTVEKVVLKQNHSLSEQITTHYLAITKSGNTTYLINSCISLTYQYRPISKKCHVCDRSFL